MKYDWSLLVPQWKALCASGFSEGISRSEELPCVGDALCLLLGAPKGETPPCVVPAIGAFTLHLNDASHWHSFQSRAAGLYRLGLAQIGSQGIISKEAFLQQLAPLLIRRILPCLFREVFPEVPSCLAAATRCEQEGTGEAASAAQQASPVTNPSVSAGWEAWVVATYAVKTADIVRHPASRAADYLGSYAAAIAVRAASAVSYLPQAEFLDPEKYLRLGAELAVESLVNLQSPGAEALTYLTEAG